MTQAALAYLKAHGLLEYAARFDVVAITWPDDAARPTIEHFENAFRLSARASFSAETPGDASAIAATIE